MVMLAQAVAAGSKDDEDSASQSEGSKLAQNEARVFWLRRAASKMHKTWRATSRMRSSWRRSSKAAAADSNGDESSAADGKEGGKKPTSTSRMTLRKQPRGAMGAGAVTAPGISDDQVVLERHDEPGAARERADEGLGGPEVELTPTIDGVVDVESPGPRGSAGGLR